MKLTKLFGENIDITPDEFAEAVTRILSREDSSENIRAVSGKVIWNVCEMMKNYESMLESRDVEPASLRKILKEMIKISVWVCSRSQIGSTDEVTDLLIDTLIRKNQDYGNSSIKNGGLVGNYVRMSDKLSRIENLIKGEASNYESLEDSWLDLAGYATLGIIILDLTEKALGEYDVCNTSR